MGYLHVGGVSLALSRIRLCQSTGGQLSGRAPGQWLP
jgi:hypothetical protein